MPAAWKVQHLRDQRLNRSSLTSFGTGTFLHISIITLLSMSIQNWSFRCQPFSLKTMERKYSATEKKFHNLKTFIDSKCKILLYFRFIFVILEWGACRPEGLAPRMIKGRIAAHQHRFNSSLFLDFPQISCEKGDKVANRCVVSAAPWRELCVCVSERWDEE